MSFTTFWYEALPFNISYCSDELSEYSRHSSCLRYFPCCVRRHFFFFSQLKTRLLGREFKSLCPALSLHNFCCGCYLLQLLCCSQGQLQHQPGGKERAGACKANIPKALAPNFTSADAGKHSVTVLWSIRLPLQTEDSAWKWHFFQHFP